MAALRGTSAIPRLKSTLIDVKSARSDLVQEGVHPEAEFCQASGRGAVASIPPELARLKRHGQP